MPQPIDQMFRLELTMDRLQEALRLVAERTGERTREKGLGAFASDHEALGWLEEERLEVLEAVHRREAAQTLAEWIDVAVVAVWAVASKLYEVAKAD